MKVQLPSPSRRCLLLYALLFQLLFMTSDGVDVDLLFTFTIYFKADMYPMPTCNILKAAYLNHDTLHNFYLSRSLVDLKLLLCFQSFFMLHLE